MIFHPPGRMPARIPAPNATHDAAPLARAPTVPPTRSFTQLAARLHLGATLPPIAAPIGTTSPAGARLPAGLQRGVEQASGYDMSDVRVHRNSDRPARIDALAYAQSNTIHLAPGQERHLPHEAWHVVQQRQGRATARRQVGGLGLDTDPALEREADRALPSPRAEPVRAAAPPASNSSVVQAVLAPPDAKALNQFLLRLVVLIHGALTQRGIRVPDQALPGLLGRIERMGAEARAMDSLQEAKLHVLRKAAAIVEAAKIPPRDSAFSLLEGRHQPPRLQMERAGLLPDAMLATNPSPSYHADAGYTGTVMLGVKDIQLQLFLRLHRSVQRVLRFANQGDQRLPLSHGLRSGHDMLGTVGRLSPMIAHGDFVPTRDTRLLPMNWTTETFIHERGAKYDLDDLRAILKAIENNERELKSAQNEEKGRKPVDVVKFHGRLPTSATHSIGLHAGTGGAVRLDFAEGRRILQQVSPKTEGEDLSYENIVRYLRQQSGALLDTQIRQGYAAPTEASPFLRELLALLVGIEGTQNNVMALHAPIVTDLVAQGGIQWEQALFTGQRKPRKEDIPYFAYAADKTQKGSSASSEGPMVRQSWLLQHRRFNQQHLVYDTLGDKRYEAEKAQYDQGEKQRNVLKMKYIAEQLSKEKAKIEKEIDLELARLKEEDAAAVKGGSKPSAHLPARAKATVERAHKEVAASMFDRESPPKPAPVPHPDLRRAQGYKTFKDEYMQRQFDLQDMFLRQIFPQIASLRFSDPAHFLEFCQRLFERYMLQRFYGDRWKPMATKLDTPPRQSPNIIIL